MLLLLLYLINTGVAACVDAAVVDSGAAAGASAVRAAVAGGAAAAAVGVVAVGGAAPAVGCWRGMSLSFHYDVTTCKQAVDRLFRNRHLCGRRSLNAVAAGAGV